jgi:radical SAM protein with 4Fe4S-binding SPASM domain
MMLLADGNVPLCNQDVRGASSIGNWHKESLGEIWTCRPLAEARAAHQGLRLEQYPLCAACDEWFRP